MLKPTFDFEKKAWKKGFKYVIGIDEVGRGCFAGPIVVGAVIFPEDKIKNRKFSRKSQATKKEKIDRTSNLGASQKIAIAGFCDEIDKLGIDDSKKLKPRVRERLVQEIKRYALAWDITEVGVSVINKIGIGKATEKAMRKAVRDTIEKLEVRSGKLEDEVGSEKWEDQGNQKVLPQVPSSHLSLRTAQITSLNSSKTYVLIDGFYVKYLRGIGLKNQKGIVKGDCKSLSIAAASILAKVHRDKLMQRLSKKCSQYKWGKNKGYGTKEHQNAIERYGMTRWHRKAFIKAWREKKHC